MRRWLWTLAIGIRVVAAGLLLVGPWTDEAVELDGWDSDRFQQIHDAPGLPWIDHPVEYPPGTVAIVALIARPDVVDTQRILVVTSLIVDLGVAGLLARFAPPTRRRDTGSPHDGSRGPGHTGPPGRGDTGLAYLLLGTPLVPMGLLRLDLWATACTAVALVLLRRTPTRTGLFGLVVTAGAAIKIAPGLLVAVALATRRRSEAVAAAALGVLACVAWLAWAGPAALDQVLSLREVTGWHLESLPGSVLALLGDETPRLEADAFRVGTLHDSMVLAGRVATVAAIGWLGVVTHRATGSPGALDPAQATATMMLGSTAALVVLAPLLSPQFLLWLTPSAALVWTSPSRRPAVPAAGAIVVTALTLAVFGPPDLAHPVAASALLVRDGLLIVTVIACAQVDRNTRRRSTAPAHGLLVRNRRSMRWPTKRDAWVAEAFDTPAVRPSKR